MADIPEVITQSVARDLHNNGIELTPTQVDSIRKKAFHNIRERMRALGYNVPDGDLELLDLIKKCFNND